MNQGLFLSIKKGCTYIGASLAMTQSVMGGWEKVSDQTKGFCLLNISQSKYSNS